LGTVNQNSHRLNKDIDWFSRQSVIREIKFRSSTDRTSDYGSEGWGFESLQAHHLTSAPKHFEILWGLSIRGFNGRIKSEAQERMEMLELRLKLLIN
jgi:hypothetical protein